MQAFFLFGGCFKADQMVVELPLQAKMDRLEQLILKLLSEAGGDEKNGIPWIPSGKST